ncbi:hypothetical protein [Natronorubrum texcoconense]|uniref:Uncharacterized protein n=1 Tax=Natronorubrum texcoconense TaxID=1095776 RepID=A0A1G9H5Q9_9EURY|nr:hypothetical protein [Natronorubrum texcoconense]SDL08328.1 hypothetical protein SAMN04515672_0115 [Natronorubrum texcoconense]
MSRPPGLPRLAVIYLTLVGILIISVGAAHGLLSLPIFLFAFIEAPAVFGWVVLAFAGWTVLYITEILQIVRLDGAQMLKDVTENIFNQQWLYIIAVFGLIALYLNIVIGIAAVVAATLYGATGIPIVALLVALLYPGFDFGLSIRWYSPGSLILAGVLEILHLFGLLREVSVASLLESLRLQGRSPDIRAHPS